MPLKDFIILNQPMRITAEEFVETFFDFEYKIEKTSLNYLLYELKEPINFAMGFFENFTIIFGGSIASIYEMDIFYPWKIKPALNQFVGNHKSVIISNGACKAASFYINGEFQKKETISLVKRKETILSILNHYLSIDDNTLVELKNIIIANSFRETDILKLNHPIFLVHYDKNKLMDSIKDDIPKIWDKYLKEQKKK